MKIAIIGASISGLACAGLLLKEGEGHDVTVFEQHTQELSDQGAGITITPELIARLKELHILDNNSPAVHIHKRRIISNKENQSEIICAQNFSANGLHWQTLYAALKAQVPEEKIKKGCRVTKIDGTTLTFTHQQQPAQATFDFILGADGYHSLTAQTICNEILADYAGYIAWRGTTKFHHPELFGQSHASHALYFVYPKGHCIMYLIHEPETNEVLINWVLYEKRIEATLKNVLPFNEEYQQYQTIARGQLPELQKQYLHDLAKQLPKEAQSIIMNTIAPFIQPIYLIRPNLKVSQDGKIALLGDAAGTLPPQAGSGAVKGLLDALQIIPAIKANDLKSWGHARKMEDEKLFALASRMQDFWVLDMPDWQNMSAQDFEESWGKLMSGQKWYAANPSPIPKAKL